MKSYVAVGVCAPNTGNVHKLMPLKKNASENRREQTEALSQEISQFEVKLVKTKSEQEDSIKFIDNTSDKIREESTELRNKIVKHVDALLQDHLSDLVRNVKEQKEGLSSFKDAVSDRQLLVVQ